MLEPPSPPGPPGRSAAQIDQTIVMCSSCILHVACDVHATRPARMLGSLYIHQSLWDRRQNTLLGICSALTCSHGQLDLNNKDYCFTTSCLLGTCQRFSETPYSLITGSQAICLMTGLMTHQGLHETLIATAPKHTISNVLLTFEL